jgi:hypothetical protein
LPRERTPKKTPDITHLEISAVGAEPPRRRNPPGRGARERPRVPFNNRQGQDNSKEIVDGKQQASRAAAQESKRRKKSIQDSASDREEASESEYPEFAYQARPEELRLGTRVEIAAENEDEGGSPSFYGRTAGDLDTLRQKRGCRNPKVQDRLDNIY